MICPVCDGVLRYETSWTSRCQCGAWFDSRDLLSEANARAQEAILIYSKLLKDKKLYI